MTFVVMFLYYKLTCKYNFGDKYHFIVIIIFIVIVIGSQ